MTLRRQLLIIVAILFMLMFVGTFAISLSGTRNYLLNQLESHAQDAATSLGLSLSLHMRNNDLAMMNSMVDAIFDRGYYREIAVDTVEGERLIERIQEVTVEGVPSWFVRALPLETPRQQALVMAGWRNAGTVYVSSHPGYAYRELWHRTVETFWWFMGVAALALALGMLMLRVVLRALRGVEQQAEAISAREYLVQEKLPRTRELRRVVEVMNKMSSKIQQMFEEQSALTERMRNEIASDPVTGLGNRHYFDAQLENLIQAPEEFHSGALFLVELAEFKRYNDAYGYEAGDRLLREAAALLREVAGGSKGVLLARLSGAHFAMLVDGLEAHGAEALAQRMSEALRPLQQFMPDEGWAVAQIGAALFQEGQTSSELLAAADLALRAAQQRGALAWQVHAEAQPAQGSGHGAAYWRERLQQVIERNSILLQFQPVRRCSSTELIHHEVLLRIPGENGEVLPAGKFMPMAESLGLGVALDRLVVERLLARLDDVADTRRYAINLASESLLDVEFLNWLCAQLAARPTGVRRLAFELPEYEVIAHLEHLRAGVSRLVELGCRFGVDHCGRGFASFGYLRALKVDYLKIDGGYIRGIERSKDSQFFVESLIKVAHSLDIQVIAEAVETEQEFRVLPALYLDGAQGYFVGRPRD
ncbi:MAG: EAL domain-containing protein [Pseudomonadota bacterium]